MMFDFMNSDLRSLFFAYYNGPTFGVIQMDIAMERQLPKTDQKLSPSKLFDKISKMDSHRTVHIAVDQLKKPITEVELNEILNRAQQMQTQHNLKAIWVHLDYDNLNHIQFLISKEYQMHRAVHKSVSLFKWCQKNVCNNIPPFSRFFVGCGAAIIKDNHLFLVQEKSGDRKGYFGIPGGRADAGEFISVATERQLYEETHLRGTFQFILYFRQKCQNIDRELDKSLWGSSDLYFVSVVKVEEEEFKNLKLCPNEIESTKWVHLDELEEFTKEHSIGSQLHVGKHITDLYRRGYDFTKKSNESEQKKYRPDRDLIMTEHILTGLNLK